MLSVVIPAYNEALGIRATVLALRAGLDRLGLEHEILVIDNASTDATIAEVEAVADEHVRVLRNPRNLGKGGSMRRGMLEARGELRLHCDADCAGSLPALPRMLELIEGGADLVVGSRLAPGADLGRRQSLPRRVMGRSFVTLCRILLRERTTDLFCGFKLWRAEAAEPSYRLSKLDGWTFDAETVAMARALGFRIAELGIPWQDREGSRLSMARVLVPVTRELLAARRTVREAAASEAAAEGPVAKASTLRA